MNISEKLQHIAERMRSVSNAAYYEGSLDGFDEGEVFANDMFWADYQGSGERTNYAMAFAGKGWTPELFRPQYDMQPTNALSMFQYSDMPIDLETTLNNRGVTLNLSKCENHNNVFANTLFTRIGVVDLTNCTANSSALFAYSTQLEKIDLLRLHPTATDISYARSFDWCNKLQYITIDDNGGKFCKDVNLQWSPLTLESAKSIITHLKNLFETGEDFSATITFSNRTWELLNNDTSVFDFRYDTWREYIEQYLGWEIG